MQLLTHWKKAWKAILYAQVSLSFFTCEAQMHGAAHGNGLSMLPNFLANPAAFLQLAADVAAVAASACACVILGQAAWKLRRQISLGPTGYVLASIVIAIAVKRWIDVTHPRGSIGSDDSRYLMMTAILSVLIALGIWLLLPFMDRLANYGLTAGVEHEKFVALAENTGDSFCMMESVHNSLHRIVDFRFFLRELPC